ncbi:Trihelix transcription factor GTL1 [Hibiscus syriacus]|uniref:Trihelix transcription factor GTL1 n=1 Tax=Hibiscus syriacus TaxID=106335 RepID=A0A6A2ZE40_HIBSY|nr:trihelix transcription factor GT-2-like [Hibiscus syriacus]KAE8689185.1 Trihelix transcription factor GTL1 [Hibiscus syriacus]
MMENSSSPENNTVVGNVSSDNEEEAKVKNEESERNFSSGNRWPRQETLALLNIRSEMDVAFRDSGVKAPLWEEVSRKMAELGFIRSDKKCKEKFENIYKYYRRTKECRSGKANGKNYRFFEQLEALPSFIPPASGNFNASVEPLNVIHEAIPFSARNPASNFNETSTSMTSSSSKELDESDGTRKKKRKQTDLFERLMREMREKQENLQNKFIEAIEKCEQDRMAREEAWKVQELARIKRERELLVQERSIAAAKDAAVLAFLQKFSDQSTSVQLSETTFPVEKAVDRQENSYGSESYTHLSNSRWPKDEVEALIRLRTNLDLQYQDNSPKGPPLWEEISTAMKKLGYDRSAKRCKEKWENMNKYFKRVKASNKKRPEDSKTCSYFNQLDALHKEKIKRVDGAYELKPEEVLMHMMGAQEERPRQESATEDGESENGDQTRDDNRNTEGGGDGFPIIGNDPSSMAIIG